MHLKCEQHGRRAYVSPTNVTVSHRDGSPCTTKGLTLGVLEFSVAAVANGVHNTRADIHFGEAGTALYRSR